MGLHDLDHADADGAETGKTKTQGGGGHRKPRADGALLSVSRKPGAGATPSGSGRICRDRGCARLETRRAGRDCGPRVVPGASAWASRLSMGKSCGGMAVSGPTASSSGKGAQAARPVTQSRRVKDRRIRTTLKCGQPYPRRATGERACDARGQSQVEVLSRQRRRLRGRVTMNSPKDWSSTPISNPISATGSWAS